MQSRPRKVVKKYDYLLFSFDEDWEGLDVTVVVKRGWVVVQAY